MDGHHGRDERPGLSFVAARTAGCVSRRGEDRDRRPRGARCRRIVQQHPQRHRGNARRRYSCAPLPAAAGSERHSAPACSTPPSRPPSTPAARIAWRCRTRGRAAPTPSSRAGTSTGPAASPGFAPFPAPRPLAAPGCRMGGVRGDLKSSFIVPKSTRYGVVQWRNAASHTLVSVWSGCPTTIGFPQVRHHLGNPVREERGMAATGSDEFGSDPQSQQRSEPENIEELREDRNELKWATERARRHLVRLGKWRRERGEPTSADLSGAGTLVKVGDRKGILTAAHNIRWQVSRRQGRAQGRDDGCNHRQTRAAIRGLGRC